MKSPLPILAIANSMTFSVIVWFMFQITRTCPGCSADQAISRKLCSCCGENLRKRENADARKQVLNEKFQKTSFHYLKTALKKKACCLF